MKSTAERLKKLYQNRIFIQIPDSLFLSEYSQKFRIDGQKFILTLNFHLIDISP
ncbi:MAG: hypothetical protein IJ642_07000 [Oscillospiraceae bacterium]|nr:hypothetical protein [Oscillospiraceae bacterium]